MPLLSILIVLIAVQTVPWPEPLVGGEWWHIAITTLFTVAVPVLYSANVSVRVVKNLNRFPTRRGTASRMLERGRIISFILNVACLGVALVVSGWGWLIWHGPWQIVMPENKVLLAPFAELLVPLPYIFATILSWLVTYPAERELFRTTPIPPPLPFFSPLGFLWFKFRFYALFVLFPTILTAGQQSFTRFFPAYAEHPVTIILGFLGVIGLFLFLPLAVPRAFGWIPMRNDSVRERLERLAKRAGFRYRNLYVWPTRGSMANALVLGVIPQARFVVFTDKLLDSLDANELDAVFGHEIGHVHHGHIPYYVLFLMLSFCVVIAGITAVFESLKYWGIVIPEQWNDWIVPLPIIALGFYLFLAFGYLSRRCERQADLFGSKAVSCSDSKCTGHDEETTYPERVGNLCPTGLRTFAAALDRVVGSDSEKLRGWALIWSWVRSWQHGPPATRIQYLLSLTETPEEESQFQRRAFALRVAIVVILVAVTVGLVWLVGWRQVLTGLEK